MVSSAGIAFVCDLFALEERGKVLIISNYVAVKWTWGCFLETLVISLQENEFCN